MDAAYPDPVASEPRRHRPEAPAALLRLFPVAERRPAAPPARVPADAPAEPLAPELERVLRALRTPCAWLGADDAVRWAHPGLDSMRVVGRGRVRVPEIGRMVDQARSTDQVVQRDLSIRRPGRRLTDIRLRVRAAPMPSRAVLVLVEDVSEAERLDHVRRDFVANVSHELKTPVGALSILAEAVSQARDDPAAVAHFAARMVGEARRLTTLINDLLDLSRLEGIDPEHPLEQVSIDDVVRQACDDAAGLAQSKDIQFLRGGLTGLMVLGVRPQLVAALRNLIVNAINYSPESTKVAVTTGHADRSVTIAVTDQGIGIPTTELDRIFERFYRVDPARSRDTGGTGLGLAIVKHVCANHGGHVDVWSRVGEGSTFTIRLPELAEAAVRHPAGRAARPPKEGT